MSPPNTSLEFAMRLKTGLAIEEVVMAHLKKKGWLIIPATHIVRTDGKGPRARPQQRRLFCLM